MGEVKKPRLIDANDLLALVKKNAPFIYSILAPISLLCPTIEAEPVRNGKWISSGYYDRHKQPIYECSVCHKEVADSYFGMDTLALMGQEIVCLMHGRINSAGTKIPETAFQACGTARCS